MQTFKRLYYLLLCEQTRGLTDHQRLLFFYAPVALGPSLGRHKIVKVLR